MKFRSLISEILLVMALVTGKELPENHAAPSANCGDGGVPPKTWQHNPIRY